MEYEAVIGLEIHTQLATRSKIFSCASTTYGAEPNTQACAVDLGLPGVLPVLNGEVVRMAAMFGLATHSTVAPRSVFARKNYFYPDLPKGYQISQYELPVVGEGRVERDLDVDLRAAVGGRGAPLLTAGEGDIAGPRLVQAGELVVQEPAGAVVHQPAILVGHRVTVGVGWGRTHHIDLEGGAGGSLSRGGHELEDLVDREVAGVDDGRPVGFAQRAVLGQRLGIRHVDRRRADTIDLHPVAAAWAQPADLNLDRAERSVEFGQQLGIARGLWPLGQRRSEQSRRVERLQQIVAGRR